MTPLRQRAPAKVNLTLEILGRRADGFHELDSIVAFAGCAADIVTLEPGPRLELKSVDGPFAGPAGPDQDNLVLNAARAVAERIEGLKTGSFSLIKRLPVAAGLGGGSADAAAALRLIAAANGLAFDDPRLVDAAAATGSDVPVCLASCAARMTGRGEGVRPVELAPIAIVLANPMKGLSTAEVFSRLGLKPGETGRAPGRARANLAIREPIREPLAQHEAGRPKRIDLAALAPSRNDLEPPARALLAEIGEGIDAIAASEGCRLARMSGSGATVFGLYDDQRAARRAARALRSILPGWWIRPSMLS